MLNYTNTSTIYISQDTGNDFYSGYAPRADEKGNGPIQSLARLEEMLNTMRACGVLQPITVKFMGDYYLEKTLSVGFDLAPGIFANTHPMKNVTFESYGEKKARLIGGKKLTGFQKSSFNGVDCLALHIPEVKEGKWQFTDLYVNGKRADAARYPKTGTLRGITTELPEPSRYLFDGSKWFIANKEDLEGIEGIENATVSFYHYWIDEHSPVESYDPETGRLEMAYRSRFNLTVSYEPAISSDLHYYLENIPQAFSAPNEWYLDVPGGMLYYIPEDWSIAPEDYEIFAPTLSRLIEVKGNAENKVCGIRFRNLEMLCSRGDYASTQDTSLREQEDRFGSDAQAVHAAPGAIYFEHTEDSGLYDCRLTCLGLHGVQIHYGCNAVRVENCSMTELGGGGVKIYGRNSKQEAELATSHCVVRGNLIQNCGKRYAASCGILINHAAHNEVSDNEVCYLDYTGISAGWVWGYSPSTTYGNLIRGNHIHHIGMGRLSDMGGIYLLGYQNGTVVEGNLIHDVTSAHYGGWGIYTDEGSSYITVEKNVVYNCKSNCYHQHYGSYNTVRDNIFAFAGESLVRTSRREAHLGLLVEHNTLIANGTPMFSCLNVVGPTVTLQTSHNRFWDISGTEPVMYEGTKKLTLAQWQNLYGLDEESLVEKPSNKLMSKLPTELQELLG